MSSRWPRTSRPMWTAVLLLCLPRLGLGMPLHALQSLSPARNESAHGPQPPSPSGALPVTPTVLATSSEAPALSLNLGLNFKIKVRSQGKSRPGEGTAGATSTRPAVPTQSQAPGGGARFWAEALGGSGWPGPGPAAADELPSEPGGWAWDGSSARSTRLDPWAPAPTPQHPFSLWPRRAEKGPVVPAVPSQEEGESKELEFKIDIDLTAGLGKEGALAPNGSSSSSPGRQYPLLPGLRVGIKEITSKLGLFGSTLPPETWEPPEWNATGSSWQEEGDSHPTPVWVSGPGLESSSLSASPGSEGAFVALPGCLPGARPEDCGSPRPELDSPPLSSLLLPSLPLFVPLHSDWNTAQADWGLAWEAHIFGAGALFALLALLSLLGLLALPCRCPPGGGGRLLALLHLLLLGAGGARAGLLFGEAWGQLERFPDVAVRLMHDLALPCLTSAFAVAFLLLSLRSRLQRSARTGSRPACLLALLVVLHFSVAAGAVLAADLLSLFPFVLLASRGVFALLAAGLSSSFLIFSCLARAEEAAQVYDLKSAPPPAGRWPFAEAREWQRAARTALPAACFGLLSAALQTYAILHALGFGLSQDLFGPWPWWALQLACRLCEAGMGLPLACLGLYPLLCPPCGHEGWGRCCGRLLCLSPDHRAAGAAVKTQILPNNHFQQWGLSQHEKLVVCDTITRSESDYLPLYALPAGDPSGARAPASPRAPAAEDAGDPTADFRPPSPIDLRRSIDEALCSEGLFQEGSALYASSTFSFSLTREPPSSSSSSSSSSLGSHLSRTASCAELVPARSSLAAGEASPETSAPNTTLSSPGPWPGSSGATSPSKQSTGACSLVLCSPSRSPSPGGSPPPVPAACGSPPRSPPPPGRQYWVLTPVSQESLASVGRPPPPPAPQGTDAALLQEQFLDVCRQIDTLSVSSDTIDL
uniref:Proline-rich transmembrane protein 4 n=1 Tax=Pogona vitticeps TaxID=103695 RepID=A0ABM5GLC7_9SAUR